MKSVRTVALGNIGPPSARRRPPVAARVKTLPLRMDAHLHNAQKVADFLAAHPAVKKVIYPGWPAIRATMPSAPSPAALAAW